MDRQFILSEVKRTATENGGVPIGRLRLENETGIKEHHWTKYWARYGDLVKEAGFKPNTLSQAYSQNALCHAFALLTREIGRFPTENDLRVKDTSDDQFPSHTVFRKTLGNKSALLEKVQAYCEQSSDFDDVLKIFSSINATQSSGKTTERENPSDDGFVYLIKSGRFYKIGRSVHAGARERQLAIQLPEATTTIHVIRTDDPTGIEAYWHRRFADKRKNGEWFDLSRIEISAFKRRKFM